MKILLLFNVPDTPEGVNKSQKLEGSVEEFIATNSAKFVDPVITGNKLEFTKSITEEGPIKGYAVFFEVPDDFQN